MILKVQAPNRNAVESWRFFEDVQGMHYSLYSNEVAYQEANANVVESTEVQTVDFRSGSNPYTGFVECCFSTPNEGLIHLLANMEVYLLQSNGKTIERIN